VCFCKPISVLNWTRRRLYRLSWGALPSQLNFKIPIVYLPFTNNLPFFFIPSHQQLLSYYRPMFSWWGPVDFFLFINYVQSSCIFFVNITYFAMYFGPWLVLLWKKIKKSLTWYYIAVCSNEKNNCADRARHDTQNFALYYYYCIAAHRTYFRAMYRYDTSNRIPCNRYNTHILSIVMRIATHRNLPLIW